MVFSALTASVAFEIVGSYAAPPPADVKLPPFAVGQRTPICCYLFPYSVAPPVATYSYRILFRYGSQCRGTQERQRSRLAIVFFLAERSKASRKKGKKKAKATMTTVPPCA